MKFNGYRQFGHRALTILRRIGLLILCEQLCRIEHADLAESLGIDSRGFLSQTLSILQLKCRNPPRRNYSAESDLEFG